MPTNTPFFFCTGSVIASLKQDGNEWSFTMDDLTFEDINHFIHVDKIVKMSVLGVVLR
jgi:hypothetical protein